jgi:hypothetical protein
MDGLPGMDILKIQGLRGVYFLNRIKDLQRLLEALRGVLSGYRDTR